MPDPWSEVKSNRGRKKTISTQYQFCSHPVCKYYLIADENIHALVGSGTHGKYEEIQDLICQACHKKFTIRKHTILFRLKTHSETVRLALQLLALGVDISALEEALKIRESTLRMLLVRSGMQARKLHERFFQGLLLSHVQLDELWANTKQEQHDLWVWVAMDAKTKIIPVLQLGARTQEMAYAVVHELKSRLKVGNVPVFSTDGLKHYFYALTAHFGEWVHVEGEKKLVWMILSDFYYAQVIKRQRKRHTVEVEQRHIWGHPAEYQARLKADGMSGNINTAFVERVNLTIRQSVSKLTRRTWGRTQYSSELVDHLYWWMTYYHFVREHESLRLELDKTQERKGKQRARKYKKRTPAMAAGVTERRWSVMELISFPLP
jgi:IS1 family transposase